MTVADLVAKLLTLPQDVDVDIVTKHVITKPAAPMCWCDHTKQAHVGKLGILGPCDIYKCSCEKFHEFIEEEHS